MSLNFISACSWLLHDTKSGRSYIGRGQSESGEHDNPLEVFCQNLTSYKVGVPSGTHGCAGVTEGVSACCNARPCTIMAT